MSVLQEALDLPDLCLSSDLQAINEQRSNLVSFTECIDCLPGFTSLDRQSQQFRKLYRSYLMFRLFWFALLF